MTGSDRAGHARECGAEVAACALGTLEPAEAEALCRHLETCVVCRDELALFQQVADIRSLSAPPHGASKALRRRVLVEVRRDAAGRERERRRRSWRLLPSCAKCRPALALGVLLAAVVIAVGGLELGSSAPSLSEVCRAQVVRFSGSAEVRVTNGHAELVVHHLAPPAGQIYEVWVARPNRKPQPARALFNVTASGARVVNIPGDLDGSQQLMVTSEPVGGSAVPANPAVITADLL